MAATETLPAIPITYSSEAGVDFRINRVQFGDGYTQRSADGINNIVRSWQVAWIGITKTEANTLEDFFNDDLNGGTDAFLWTDPITDVERQWSLVERSFRRVPAGHDTENVTAQFVQEFDL